MCQFQQLAHFRSFPSCANFNRRQIMNIFVRELSLKTSPFPFQHLLLMDNICENEITPFQYSDCHFISINHLFIRSHNGQFNVIYQILLWNILAIQLKHHLLSRSVNCEICDIVQDTVQIICCATQKMMQRSHKRQFIDACSSCQPCFDTIGIDLTD